MGFMDFTCVILCIVSLAMFGVTNWYTHVISTYLNVRKRWRLLWHFRNSWDLRIFQRNNFVDGVPDIDKDESCNENDKQIVTPCVEFYYLSTHREICFIIWDIL